MAVDQQIEIFDTPLVSARKLDADHYTADDIDGVTESIFGSGNMAYASLQASQTDAAIALNEAADLESDQTPEGSSAIISGRTTSVENLDSFSIEEEPGSTTPAYISRSPDSGESAGPETIATGGNPVGHSISAPDASALTSASHPAAFGLSAGSGGNIEHSTAANTTINNETNIVDVDDTVQNIVNTINENITDITNLGDQIVDNIVNLGDEIIENVLGDNISEVTETLTNGVSEITEILNSEINNVTETVNNLLEETGITEITSQVADITNGITGNITDIVDGVLDNVLGGGITINLDTGVLDSLGMDIGIAADSSIAGIISTDLVSDNLGALAGDLTGLDVPLVSDTGIDIGFDLLGDSDPDGGEDLAISGLGTPDIALDPVESIVGDIDLTIELPAEIANSGPLVGSSGSALENLDDISLADPNEILDILGSQDTGALEIVAGDTTLNEDFDTGADSIIQDVEGTLNIEDALSLDGAGLGDTSNLLADTGEILPDTAWTESIGDAGGLFDDIVGGIGGEADALPDPVGTVAEGLGALDVAPELDAGSLGGLFG